MDKSEAEAAIKKLDLKLRQLQLQQRIMQRESKDKSPPWSEKRLRRQDNFAMFEGILGMLGLLMALLFRDVFIAIGAAFFLMHPLIWFGWERKGTIDAPVRLQRETDALEAEIARHNRIVEGE